MTRRYLIALVVCGSGMAAAWAGSSLAAWQEPKKWEVADPIGPTTALAFDTNEGTWMNVDVSPDGTQVVFDLLGDIYLAPDRRQLVTGAAPDERPGLRHAAALQPRRQAHRHRQRPRRPVEHLDDRSRRQGRAADLARAALVRQQSRRGRPMAPTSTRGGTSSRSARSAPARSGCTTRPDRATACRSPNATAGRKMPANQTSRPMAARSITARTSRPVRRSSTTRIPTGRSTRSCGAIWRLAASAAPSACRAVRSRRRSPPTASRSPTCGACACRAISTSAISSPAAIVRSLATSTRICRRPGRFTDSTRSTPGPPTASRS